MERVHRASLYVLYQLSLLAGIVLLPIALGLRRAGLSLPIHRVVERLGNAYDRTATEP